MSRFDRLLERLTPDGRHVLILVQEKDEHLGWDRKTAVHRLTEARIPVMEADRMGADEPAIRLLRIQPEDASAALLTLGGAGYTNLSAVYPR